MKKQKKQKKPESLKYSLRIGGRVTSITLKRNIVSLWLTLSDFDISGDPHSYILDFIYNTLDNWEKDNAKGLSNFVTQEIIKSMLEKRDFVRYVKIFESL